MYEHRVRAQNAARKRCSYTRETDSEACSGALSDASSDPIRATHTQTYVVVCLCVLSVCMLVCRCVGESVCLSVSVSCRCVCLSECLCVCVLSNEPKNDYVVFGEQKNDYVRISRFY